MQSGRLQIGCQRHQTKVASHTETPLGVSKWLVWRAPPKYKPAFTVGDKVSSCPLPSGKVPGMWCRFPSHFAAPRGAAVWLATIVRCQKASFFANCPLSDAYRHLLIAEGHDKTKGTIWDLTYSALKVHQNTGRW